MIDHLRPPAPTWERSRRALRALRPVGEVGGFSGLFLVTSLLLAMPFALLTGEQVVGIWYILPFTLIFLTLYQRWLHKERLRDLGLLLRRRWSLTVVVGFTGSGVAVAVYTSAQLGTGWMEVEGVHPLLADPALAGAGFALALAANLGLGLGEELIFRGYVLRRLLSGYRSPWIGVGLSSVLYSAFHVPMGRSALVLFNLFLLGVVLALAVVITRALWLSIGIHAGWNFWLNGVCIYDPSDLERSRVLRFEYHLGGQGDLVLFKLIVSAVLVVAIVALALRLRRAAQSPAEEEVS